MPLADLAGTPGLADLAALAGTGLSGIADRTELAGPAVHPPLGFELAGVLLGGLSGSLFAVQRRFPVTGEFTLGIASALGGGILRDIVLDRAPAALTSPWYLPTAVTGALLGFLFGSLAARRLQLTLDVLDPLWMGLFAVLGADAALAAGTTTTGAVLVGCVTAVGGGVLRDLLAGETPQLVLPGPINYLAGITGSILYTLAVTATPAGPFEAACATVAVVVGLRLVALRYGVMAPGPPDLRRSLAAGRAAIGRPARIVRARRRGRPGPAGHPPASHPPA